VLRRKRGSRPGRGPAKAQGARGVGAQPSRIPAAGVEGIVAQILERVVRHDLDLAAVATELEGATTAHVLSALQGALAGDPQNRDAACAVIDAVAARPDGPQGVVAAARRLPPDSTPRVLMLAVASEHPSVQLSPDERIAGQRGGQRHLGNMVPLHRRKQV